MAPPTTPMGAAIRVHKFTIRSCSGYENHSTWGRGKRRNHMKQGTNVDKVVFLHHWYLSPHLHWSLSQHLNWSLSPHLHWSLSQHLNWSLSPHLHWSVSPHPLKPHPYQHVTTPLTHMPTSLQCVVLSSSHFLYEAHSHPPA